MNYISLFSGVEAASVAAAPLGWEPLAFCEIDEFPSAVLAYRFPNVPNLGDVCEVDWKEFLNGRSVDLIVGGSPCQSFSVAGKREGLKGESGLMFEYIRAVRECLPKAFLWENVPGALSSEHGDAFRQLLSEMDDLGYGMAWRVLDAQFFGVAQRRRRVFLVGVLGDGDAPAEILFEPESLRWDYPSSREKRKELAAGLGRGSEAGSYALRMRAGCAGGGKGPLVQTDVSGTIATGNDQTIFHSAAFKYHQGSKTGGIGYESEQSPTLSTHPAPAVRIQGDIARGAHMGQNGCGYSTTGESYTLNTMGVPAVAFAQNTRDEVRLVNGDGAISGALAANPGTKQTTYICETNRKDTLVFNERQITSPKNGNNPQFNDQVHILSATDGAPTMICMESAQANAVIETGWGLAPTQTARQHKDPMVVCMADGNANAAVDVNLSGTLTVGGELR